METHTAISAREQLDLLRAELERRGWLADHRGTPEKPFLHVRNPADAGFNDSVACCGDRYCWNWGPEIGAVDDVQGVANRIMHVLRVVGP
ncbi:hypothetical protein ACQEVF_18055 [Nonomuraea polychroma]|uniref:hypothetical protein n=1 Tax=Nonomuraea polychroma TaxID=46176 RepID=UPI003D8CD203